MKESEEGTLIFEKLLGLGNAVKKWYYTILIGAIGVGRGDGCTDCAKSTTTKFK